MTATEPDAGLYYDPYDLLDEVLQRWPEWEVDGDAAIQARTSTVRGWERLPVRTP